MFLSAQPLRCTTALALAAIAVLTASGCGATDPLTDEDRHGLEQLTAIAPLGSNIDGEVTGVECWSPSENLIDAANFRVLCRVHYEQRGDARYRDMICIGDLNKEPVTDYCTEWAYYSDMPSFEDQRGYFAERAQ